MTLQIKAILGNITQQYDCDAIINSANTNLRAGSGVCGAIYDAAGPELEPYSVRLAPLALSECVITPGFNLCTPWVIHARGPKYQFDQNPREHLAAAMTNIVLMADSASFKRIAVPAISMGVYAYPPKLAAPILIETIRELAPSIKSLSEIRFVLSKMDVLRHFRMALDAKPRPANDIWIRNDA